MAQSIFSAPSSRNKPLVEFKAGKMLIRGKMVIPDKRQGKIEVVHSPEDQLKHFKWKDRSTGQVETDLIIFPDEVVFKRVKQCTTGRVYLLEWKTTERRLFFWMQEPSDERDAEFCEKVNKSLNNPSAAAEGGEGSAASLFGISQEQLLAMMGGRIPHRARGAGTQQASSPQPARPPAPTTPSSTSTTTTSRSAPAATVGEQQLQSILRQLAGAAPATGTQPEAGQQQEDIDLSSVITPEALLPILNNPQVAEQLLPYLPEGQRDPQELRQLVHSPQFHQALQAFNSALQSGALADVLPALGLPPSAAGGGVQEFLRTLQAQAQRQREEGTDAGSEGASQQGVGEEDEDKDGDEEDGGDGMDAS